MDDLDANGVTDMGKAFDLLAAQLTIPPMTDRALPPVFVLLSDSQPTDDYKSNLNKLLHLLRGKKAVRIAISIGQDADDGALQQFTGNPAPGAPDLPKEPSGTNAPLILDMNNIPNPGSIGAGDVW